MKIFHNANIFCPGFPSANAFAIDQGYFIALGSEANVLNRVIHAEKVIDLQGKTVWPGLYDAHVHLEQLSSSTAFVDCETGSLAACLNRIEQTAKLLPEGAWVRGHGWNHNRWKEGVGTAEMLDSITAGHPAYLTAKSLHAAWTNTKGLRIAGINHKTPDPSSGIIQRAPDGRPTGIMFEPGAMNLVERVIPTLSQSEIIANIKNIIPKLWQMGLVGLHDFDDFNCWVALQSLYQDSELNFRIRKNIPYDHLDTFIQAGLQTDFGDDWLHVGSVKLFADGALGPQTAYMKKPFEGGHNVGQLLLSSADIFKIGKKAADHGIALAIHAIGDRANEVVLDAFTKLRKYEREKHLPHYQHRIEHVQIIDPKDLKRMKILDIVASVQPVHAPSDMEMADKYLGERSRNAYAYRSMLSSGLKLVCGSDAPVEPINPFYGIHAAVTRRRIDGLPGSEGWHPEQKISLIQAVEGFSANPAVVAARGGHLGKIHPGYKADFLILDRDPFTIDAQDIAALQPIATVIEGEVVYKDPELKINL